MHTGRWKPFIATQDESHKQKECVFAWRVLLRNVKLVHKSQKGIMDELQQRKRGQICVPALTWNQSNSNISVNKPWSMSDQRWLYSHPWSEIVNWGAERAFLFSNVFILLQHKKARMQLPLKGRRHLNSSFNEKRHSPGTVRKTLELEHDHCSVHREHSLDRQTWKSPIWPSNVMLHISLLIQASSNHLHACMYVLFTVHPCRGSLK